MLSVFPPQFQTGGTFSPKEIKGQGAFSVKIGNFLHRPKLKVKFFKD
jgi:hypothetical protein